MKTRRIKLPLIPTMLLFAVATTMSALFFNEVAFAKDDARADAVKAAEIARFAAIEKSDAAATSNLLATTSSTATRAACAKTRRPIWK